MKFAFADPPYLGCAQRHYGKHHADAAAYDDVETHRNLVAELRDFYPDGWALSLHVPSLEEYLHICRDVLGTNKVRVGGWVKPFASFKPNVNPAYCWEPVLFYGGRKKGRDVPTVRDYHSANITLERGLTGAKPESFCVWIFEFLGMEPDDDLVDLFPGSNAFGRAWENYRNQTRLIA